MPIVRLLFAAACLGVALPAWAGEGEDRTLRAIRAAPSCHGAMSIATEATSGSGDDVPRFAPVVDRCQQDFIVGLDARKRAAYDGWRTDCERRFTSQAGEAGRSAAATCAADVSERFSAEALAATGRSGHGGWSHYVNNRFAFAVDIPPGFTPVNEAANSDGGTSGAVIGRADLAVWGANLIDTTFAADVRARMGSATSDGWVLSYRSATARAVSWSSTKGGRIQYTRTIVQCGDRTASMSVEYEADAKVALDPIVTRLARGLKGLAECRRRPARERTEAGGRSAS